MMATGRFRYLREISNGRRRKRTQKNGAPAGNSHNDSHHRQISVRIRIRARSLDRRPGELRGMNARLDLIIENFTSRG
jgi:hypothetical protein